MKKLIDKTEPKRKIDSKTITNGLGAEEIKNKSGREKYCWEKGCGNKATHYGNFKYSIHPYEKWLSLCDRCFEVFKQYGFLIEEELN